MADDSTVINGTPVPVPDAPSLPSVGQVIAAATATTDQLKQEETDLVTGALNDLVSGKNPLKSKTLIVNSILFLVGLVGAVGTAYFSGDVQSIMPFLVIMGSGAVNTVLRFFTTGPILTEAMQKLMQAYASSKASAK